MESTLRAKKGKRNLPVENEVYHHHNAEKEIINDSIPKIVPMYDGHELKINQKLIMNGFSTISIRNLRSNDVYNIKKRNSFFNLHRPELKGLNIVPTENQQEKTLHQHILKEVMTIHKIQSMRSLCKIDGTQSSSADNQHTHKNLQEINTKSEDTIFTGKRFLNKIKLIAFGQQKNSVDGCDTDSDESTLETNKICVHEVETKSTLID